MIKGLTQSRWKRKSNNFKYRGRHPNSHFCSRSLASLCFCGLFTPPLPPAPRPHPRQLLSGNLCAQFRGTKRRSRGKHVFLPQPCNRAHPLAPECCPLDSIYLLITAASERTTRLPRRHPIQPDRSPYTTLARYPPRCRFPRIAAL